MASQQHYSTWKKKISYKIQFPGKIPTSEFWKKKKEISENCVKSEDRLKKK